MADGRLHTTNYTRTFITVSEDSGAAAGTVPPARATPSVAALTYGRIAAAPYRWTSDDVLFAVHAERAGIPDGERDQARAAYFSVGRACLRSSPLGKTYGWGVHADEEGRVALYGVGTPEYERLASGRALDGDGEVTVVPAMRSRR